MSYQKSNSKTLMKPFGVSQKEPVVGSQQMDAVARVSEIFGQMESDVIKLILEECNWNEEKAIDKFIELAHDTQPSNHHSIDLGIIACGVLESGGNVENACQETAMNGENVSDIPKGSTNTTTTTIPSVFQSEMSEKTTAHNMHIDYEEYDKLLQTISFNTASGQTQSQIDPEVLLTSRLPSDVKNYCASGGDLPPDKTTCQRLENGPNLNFDTAFSEQAVTISGDKKVFNSGQPPAPLSLSTMTRFHVSSHQTPCAQSVTFSTQNSSMSNTAATSSTHFSTAATYFSSWQQKTSGPDYQSTDETNTKKVTGRAIFYGTPQSSVLTHPENMLSADSPEFVPSFAPSTAPHSAPQFFMPKLPGSSSQPFFLTANYAPYQGSNFNRTMRQKSVHQPNQSNAQNLTFSRFVGSNLYLQPAAAKSAGITPSISSAGITPSISSAGITPSISSAGTISYSAAAQTPKLKSEWAPEHPAVMSSIQSQGKSMAVEKIEKLLRQGRKVMVLMRGLPGSGKSYLARQLPGNGRIFSTDDFFMRGNVYEFIPEKLSDAHEWNRLRVSDALESGQSPIIVDNTNLSMWELSPYALMAYKRGYTIEVVEPQTPWCFQPKRLAKYNSHGVPIESIKRMKDRYEEIDTAALLDLTERKFKEQLENAVAPDSYTINNSVPSVFVGPQKHPVKIQPSSKPPPLRPIHVKKKRNKKRQKDLSAIQDHCLMLQEEGHPEDEIDALIFMANLSDVEVNEIRQYLNQFKKRSNKPMITKRPPVSFITVDTSNKVGLSAPNNDLLVSENSWLTGDKNSNPVPEVVTHDSDLFNSWTNPQPQRKLISEEPITDSKSEETRCESVANETEDRPTETKCESMANKTEDRATVNRSEPSWEDPRPQRRERAARQSRNSETEKSDPETSTETGKRRGSIRNSNENNFDKVDAQTAVEITLVGESRIDEVDMEYNHLLHRSPENGSEPVLERRDKSTTDVNIYIERGNEMRRKEAGEDKKNEGEERTINDSETSDNNYIKGDSEESSFKGNDESDDEAETQSSSECKDSMSDEDSEDKMDSDSYSKTESHSDSFIPDDEINVFPDACLSLHLHNNAAIETKISTTPARLCEMIEKEVPEVEKIDSGVEMPHNPTEIVDSLLLQSEKPAETNESDTGCVDDISDAVLKSAVDELGSEDSGSSSIATVVKSAKSNEADDGSSGVVRLNGEMSCTHFGHKELISVKPLVDYSNSSGEEEEYMEPENVDLHFMTDFYQSILPTVSVHETGEQIVGAMHVSKIQTQTTKQLLAFTELEGTTSDSSSPSSPVKNIRRKKHKILHSPFFDETTKIQLIADNWKSFTPHRSSPNTPSADRQTTWNDADSEESRSVCEARPDFAAACTQTDGRDFAVATRTVENSHILNEYKILVPRDNYIPFVEKTSEEPLFRVVGQKFKLDKSVTVEITQETTAEWLYSCFPGVAVGQLNEVLELCSGNVPLAVELMFEWGITTPITPHDKHHLKQEMAKQKCLLDMMPSNSLITSEEKIGCGIPNTPLKLLDLCIKVLPQNVSADTQQKLISSSKKRLKWIEKSETKRLLSMKFDDTSSEGDSGSRLHLPDHLSLTDFTSHDSPERDAVERVSVQPKQKQDQPQPLTMLPNFKQRSPKPSSNVTSSECLIRDVSQSNWTSSKASEVVDTSSEDLTVTLPPYLIQNLQQRFGDLPIPNSISAVTIALDHQSAFHLYQCLKQALSQEIALQHDTMEDKQALSQEIALQHDTMEDKRMKQVKEDEALAQWLQAEENVDLTLQSIAMGITSDAMGITSDAMRPSFAQSAGTNRAAKEGVNLASRTARPSNANGVAVETAQAGLRPQPVNLQDIMEEEMVKQKKQEKQMRILETTGDHIAIATKLKREKLQQHFPGIDERFLEEIFQSNGYCLESTVCVMETAMGLKQAVPHKLKMLKPTKTDSDEDIVSSEKMTVEVSPAKKTGDQFQSVHVWHSAELDYQELRQEALLHSTMRSECFTKAHEAYRRGMKDVASFYSEKANIHFVRMKEANMRASEKMLEIRQSQLNNEMTLDLHGFHVQEALVLLKQVIEEKELEFHRKPVYQRKHLYIITGRGKHSHQGVAKIRPAVIHYLQSSDYKFVERKPGLFQISLRPPF